MIMEKKLYTRIAGLAFFGLLFTSGIFAQIGFYEGYVVTNQNDSVFGKVGVYQNKEIIEYCILKKDNEDIKYYPDMMLRFGYNDGYCYVTKVLRDTIIQVLVQGKLSLYKLQSSFYIQKENEELHRLESHTDKVIRNGEMFYVENVKWKGIITYLTSDCDIDKKKISKLQLLEADLIEVVVDYNKCTKTEYVDYSRKKRRGK